MSQFDISGPNFESFPIYRDILVKIAILYLSRLNAVLKVTQNLVEVIAMRKLRRWATYMVKSLTALSIPNWYVIGV